MIPVFFWAMQLFVQFRWWFLYVKNLKFVVVLCFFLGGGGGGGGILAILCLKISISFFIFNSVATANSEFIEEKLEYFTNSNRKLQMWGEKR